MVTGSDLRIRNLGVETVPGHSVGVPAGQKLYAVMPGDTVRVKANVEYRGPAINDNFYAAIGNQIAFFDEIWVSGLVPISFAEATDWVPYELTADIDITKIAIRPWTPGWFDLYVKINGQPNAGMPLQQNVIEVLLASEFQGFQIGSYEILAPAS